ncbi:MAG: pilus assembly protein PilP [Bdellovibrionales bacterium]|nr:pilus assembly protein PilP [Bdellovibrionales bacterium]
MIWLSVILTTLAFGQENQGPPPPPPAPPIPSAATNPQGATSPGTGPSTGAIVRPSGSVNLLEGIIEDYNYNPDGKRDPFQPYDEDASLSKVSVAPNNEPMLPLERFDLEEIKLVGIIWGSNRPKAMFMDPDKRTHIVNTNERVGRNRGYIAAIREGEVVIVEPFGKDGDISYKTIILKLERAETDK